MKYNREMRLHEVEKRGEKEVVWMGWGVGVGDVFEMGDLVGGSERVGW